jgi:hypothetical protein
MRSVVMEMAFHIVVLQRLGLHLFANFQLFAVIIVVARSMNNALFYFIMLIITTIMLYVHLCRVYGHVRHFLYVR